MTDTEDEAADISNALLQDTNSVYDEPFSFETPRPSSAKRRKHTEENNLTSWTDDIAPLKLNGSSFKNMGIPVDNN
jgi:hypothetical protein